MLKSANVIPAALHIGAGVGVVTVGHCALAESTERRNTKI